RPHHNTPAHLPNTIPWDTPKGIGYHGDDLVGEGQLKRWTKGVGESGYTHTCTHTLTDTHTHTHVYSHTHTHAHTHTLSHTHTHTCAHTHTHTHTHVFSHTL